MLKNKKVLGFVVTMVIILFIILSCGKKSIGGNGKVITQQRAIKGIKAISITGTFDVFLKKDTTEFLFIEADKNLLDIIKTEVNDSVLDIFNLKNIVRSKELKLIISCPNINSIDFSGATDLSCDSGMIFKNLNINISGAGKVEMNLITDNLSTIVSGGAGLIFTGKAKSFSVSITGAGNIDAQELETQNCKIDISGFGRAKLNVSQKLEVNISGAGKVEYSGNPEVSQSVT